MFSLLKNLYNAGAMGVVTLGQWLGVSSGMAAFLVTLLAVGMFVGAEWLESKFREEPAE
jgi:hypothetical protein